MDIAAMEIEHETSRFTYYSLKTQNEEEEYTSSDIALLVKYLLTTIPIKRDNRSHTFLHFSRDHEDKVSHLPIKYRKGALTKLFQVA
jgi:hypothetical protein